MTLTQMKETHLANNATFEIKNNIDNVVVGSMYRPPNTNINDFLEIFKYQMNKINNMKCECIIGTRP